MDAPRRDGSTLADALPDWRTPPDGRLEVAELAWRARQSARALVPKLSPPDAQVLRPRLLAEVRQIEVQLQGMLRSKLAVGA